MRAIQPEISTIAMGTASSTATVLLVGCSRVLACCDDKGLLPQLATP